LNSFHVILSLLRFSELFILDNNAYSRAIVILKSNKWAHAAFDITVAVNSILLIELSNYQLTIRSVRMSYYTLLRNKLMLIA